MVSDGDRLSFTCTARNFIGLIENPRLYINSTLNGTTVGITEWIMDIFGVGVGSYSFSNVSLDFNSKNVSCIITDNSGQNYTSKIISIQGS